MISAPPPGRPAVGPCCLGWLDSFCFNACVYLFWTRWKSKHYISQYSVCFVIQIGLRLIPPLQPSTLSLLLKLHVLFPDPICYFSLVWQLSEKVSFSNNLPSYFRIGCSVWIQSPTSTLPECCNDTGVYPVNKLHRNERNPAFNSSFTSSIFRRTRPRNMVRPTLMFLKHELVRGEVSSFFPPIGWPSISAHMNNKWLYKIPQRKTFSEERCLI